jgi:uncharacterized membrane protein
MDKTGPWHSEQERGPGWFDVARRRVTRWVNVPLGVLATYGVLWALIRFDVVPALRFGLALGLGLGGSGAALAALLIPRGAEVDGFERSLLAVTLGLGVTAVVGMAAALSPWGLTADAVLAGACLLTLVCYLGVLAREGRRPSPPVHRDHEGGWLPQDAPGWVSVAGAVLLFVSGGWAFGHVLAMPSASPAVTEFYVLGTDGLVEGIPKQFTADEPVALVVGIDHREPGPAAYEVIATVQGATIDRVVIGTLGSGAHQEETLTLFLPGDAGSPFRMELILVRDGAAFRTLYLWFDIMSAPRAG